MAWRRAPHQVLLHVTRKLRSAVSASTSYSGTYDKILPIRRSASEFNIMDFKSILSLAELNISHRQMPDPCCAPARNFSSGLPRQNPGTSSLCEVSQDSMDSSSKLQGSEQDEADQLKAEEVLDFIDSEVPLRNSGPSTLLQTEDIEEALTKMRAKDIQMLHVSDRCDWADTLVVATGISDKHLRGMADALIYALRKQEHKLSEKQFPTVEGRESSDWLVVDFGSIVVHLFSEEARSMYDIESLWNKKPPNQLIPQS